MECTLVDVDINNMVLILIIRVSASVCCLAMCLGACLGVGSVGRRSVSLIMRVYAMVCKDVCIV